MTEIRKVTRKKLKRFNKVTQNCRLWRNNGLKPSSISEDSSSDFKSDTKTFLLSNSCSPNMKPWANSSVSKTKSSTKSSWDIFVKRAKADGLPHWINQKTTRSANQSGSFKWDRESSPRAPLAQAQSDHTSITLPIQTAFLYKHNNYVIDEERVSIILAHSDRHCAKPTNHSYSDCSPIRSFRISAEILRSSNPTSFPAVTQQSLSTQLYLYYH